VRWNWKMGFVSCWFVWVERPQSTVGVEGGRRGGTTLSVPPSPQAGGRGCIHLPNWPPGGLSTPHASGIRAVFRYARHRFLAWMRLEG